MRFRVLAYCDSHALEADSFDRHTLTAERKTLRKETIDAESDRDKSMIDKEPRKNPFLLVCFPGRVISRVL
jgi:hypothetical protein